MRTGAGRAATLFPLLLAGLLAGMTYWLDITSRPPPGARDGKSRHDPDYLVEQFTVQRFSPEGDLQHTLRATSMRHYPDDDSTFVVAPDLTWHRTPVTHITAREAQLDSEGKHVQLIDDVRIVRTGLNEKPDTVLTTARLDIWPDDEIASNAVPVTIVQGRSRVDGSRLRADNKTATYVLSGPVDGLFHRITTTAGQASEPPSRSAPSTKQAARPATKTKAKAKSKAKSRTKLKPRTRKTQTKAKLK